MIEDLLAPPPPGMVFADELAGGLHGVLIFPIASILVEALGQVRTVRRHLTESVGLQDRLIFAASGQDAEQARPCGEPLEIPHHQRTKPSCSLRVVEIRRSGDEVLRAGRQSPEFLGRQSAVFRVDVAETARFAIRQQRLMQGLVAAPIQKAKIDFASLRGSKCRYVAPNGSQTNFAIGNRRSSSSFASR